MLSPATIGSEGVTLIPTKELSFWASPSQFRASHQSINSPFLACTCTRCQPIQRQHICKSNSSMKRRVPLLLALSSARAIPTGHIGSTHSSLRFGNKRSKKQDSIKAERYNSRFIYIHTSLQICTLQGNRI